MSYTEEQKRSHIREIQGYLYQLSKQDSRIPVVHPDGIYGPETVAAVRAFQQINGLPTTGEVDRTTWNAIVAACIQISREPAPLYLFPSRYYIMREGDRGPLVYFVQAMLHTLGERYDNLIDVPINGIFEENTKNAVYHMQSIGNLPPTGYVNDQTWNLLSSSINEMQLS